MAAQAGWYVDPRDARQYRYWDGDRWSQSTQPIPELNGSGGVDDGAPAGSLSAGGAKEPVGAGAFDAAAATPTSNESDGVLADFMWTSGFGEQPDDETNSISDNSMFTPAASPAPVPTPVPPPVAPVVPPEPALPTFQTEATVADEVPSQLSPKPVYEISEDDTRFAPAPSAPLFTPPPANGGGSLFNPPPVDSAQPLFGAGAAAAAAAAAAATAGSSTPDLPSLGATPIVPTPGGPLPAPAASMVGTTPPSPPAPPAFEPPSFAEVTPAPVAPRRMPTPGVRSGSRARSKIEIYTMDEDLPYVASSGLHESTIDQVDDVPAATGGAGPFGPPDAVPSSSPFGGGALPPPPGGGGSLFAPPGSADGPAVAAPPSPDGGNMFQTQSEQHAAALDGLAGLGAADEMLTTADGKKPKKSLKRARRVDVPAASGPVPPAAAANNKNAPKSKLPILLGVLGVVIVAAAAFYFLKGSDDPKAVAVKAAKPSASTTSVAPTTTAAGGAATPSPSAPTTTSAGSTTSALAPNVIAAYQAAFAAESTRACDLIKADPGILTEAIIQYDEKWAGIGKTYQDLQKAVNDCSFAARDAALKAVAAEEAAKQGG